MKKKTTNQQAKKVEAGKVKRTGSGRFKKTAK
jgi:hypothetical protein